MASLELEREIDRQAEAEGFAIRRHNELRIKPKLRPHRTKPDTDKLAVTERTNTVHKQKDLRKIRHRQICERLANPELYKNFR